MKISGSHPSDEDRNTQILAALEGADAEALTALLAPLPHSEALRDVLNLNAAQRDHALELLPVDMVAELIEPTPAGMAAGPMYGVSSNMMTIPQAA